MMNPIRKGVASLRMMDVHENLLVVYIPVVPHKAVAEVSKIGNL